MKNTEFDPVKEETDSKAQRVIWTTKSLNKALGALEKGRRLKANPFYENNMRLLKADLVFKRTDEEVEEWKKCRDDIIYFVNKYCKLMTPEGIKNVELRDYQSDYLEHLMKNRLSIFLSCRQSGKCLSLLSEIQVIISDIHCLPAKKIKKLSHYIKENNLYEIPLFELYNLFDKSLLWKIKYKLYKSLYNITYKNKPNDLNEKILYKLISFLDKFERKDTKLIKRFDIDGFQIKTDTGFKPLSYIYLTKPFQIYRIILENGLYLDCADTHVLFRDDMSVVFAHDLIPGDFITTDYGKSRVQSIEVFPHSVCMCDVTVNDSNHRFFSNHILSHNTTTSALFILHYICFNIDKNTLVLGNKRRTAVEILDKLKAVFSELPFFLRPGVNKWNESEIVLDNGCRCLAEATTINSGISFTFHCVLCDEFAHIAPNIVDKFYNNIFPTITAARARLMITSTQNGYNLFYRLYKAAEEGESEYAPFKVDWWQVPEWNTDEHCWEPRTESWHRLQVANLGSEENFNKQFGTSFDVGANTLITQRILRDKQAEIVEFINKDMYGVPYTESWYWHPDIDPMALESESLVLTIDLAEGLGQDYTVFSVYRIVNAGLECIGYFRNNTIAREKYTESLITFLSKWAPQNTIVSYEQNTYGDIFYKTLIDLSEQHPDFDRDMLVRYYNDSGTTWRYGVKITSGSKSTYCTLFKESYERGLIINNAARFYTELTNFCDDGTGHYRASFGHDDLVMSAIQLEFVKQSLQFKLLKQEYEFNNDSQNEYDSNPYTLFNDFYSRMPYMDDVWSVGDGEKSTSLSRLRHEN